MAPPPFVPATPQPASSTPAQPAANADAPTGPPPAHPTRLATVLVNFPLRYHSPLLSSLVLPPITSSTDAPASDSTSPTAGPGQSSQTLRRKPLTSSFSIPTLVSLGSSPLPDNFSRPSRPFRGTSSSFVRSWEGLPIPQGVWKPITEAHAGKDALFGFFTIPKGVAWAEIGPGRPKDPLCKITFSAPPTCVDVNHYTASVHQLDVLLGFVTGDIVWLDPLSAKYTRLNKSGIISSSPITSIQWLPPTPTYSATENVASLFLTSHADGSMIIWDKDREDWAGFTPLSVPPSILSLGAGKENIGGRAGKTAPGMEDIVVTKSATVDKKGAKLNPVSHWRISRRPISAFALSPDLQYVATVGEDGCLRIIDVASETLLDTFVTYFGALTCVAWSPDGRFVVTGGQDDLCTVYAPHEQRLVARCQGHSSFVSAVAWDPWRSDERTTRFASVGEDCKLVLWDLSGAALSRPKSHVRLAGPYNRRQSVSSQFSLPRKKGPESTSQLPLSVTDRPSGPAYHPAPHRNDVSMLQPVMVKALSTDLLVGLLIHPDHIVTVSRSGQIKLWDRPPAGEGEGLGTLKEEFAASTVALDSRKR